MESKIQQITAFQVYSTGINDKINIMVDRLWIKNDRVFFRVVEHINSNDFIFRKEHGKNIYSIKKEDLVSIRCRLYF
ncbi:MAG: hypothetical protein ACFFB6_11850 [Promethearchaeota archaeon]